MTSATFVLSRAMLAAGACLGLVVSSPARSQWPAYIGRPAGVVLADTPLVEEFAEVGIPLPNREQRSVIRGRHWQGDMSVTGATLDTPPATVWATLRGVFPEPGWKVQYQSGTIVTLRYNAGSRVAWASLNHADPSDIRLSIVEEASQQRRHTLAAPAERTESIADSADIPYLTPLAGFSLVGGGREPVPLLAVLQGHSEPAVLALGVQQRLYAGPDVQITQLQLREIYSAALKEAGWTLVPASADEVLAHYSLRGRDIWAKVRGGSGDLHLMVADAGGSGLGEKMKAECKAVLDGVLFDFDKATLLAESRSALTRAKDAILAIAGKDFEVQGHTDNVGADAYNQRLSESRADAVRSWLVTQGVPAGRLTSRGYGRARPMVSNDSPEGRARNRRVELVCRP